MVIWFSPTNKGEQLQFLRASLLYLPIYSLVLELLGVVLGIFGTVGWNCWIKIGSMDAPKLDSCRLRTSISHRLLCQRLRYSQVLRLLPLKWLWQRRLPPITSVSVGGMRISWGCHQLYYWGDDEAKCFSRWLGHQNEGTWWLSLIIHGESRWLDLMILPFYPYLSLVASLFRTCAMLMGYPYQIRVFTWEASGGNSEFPDSWPTLDHLTDPGGCVRLVLNYPAW